LSKSGKLKALVEKIKELIAPLPIAMPVPVPVRAPRGRQR